MAFNQSPVYDLLLNAKVLIQLEEQGSATGVIKHRARDSDGNMSGRYDDNPFLNSLFYEVEFPDGYLKKYTANIIAEKMLTQVYYEGYSITMINIIIDYERDDSVAVPNPYGNVVTKLGQRRPRKLTQGWKLLVHFADES